MAALLEPGGAIAERLHLGRQLRDGAGKRLGLDGDRALGVESDLLAIQQPAVGRVLDRLGAGHGCGTKSHGARGSSSPVPARPGRHPAVLTRAPGSREPNPVRAR
jgi:hypothetical protein